MQIAGNICRVCRRRIILATEGKFCPGCADFVHLSCEPQGICSSCGMPFATFSPAKADPRSEATVPSALRPARSGGPFFAVGLLLILMFVVALILIITHGHAY